MSARRRTASRVSFIFTGYQSFRISHGVLTTACRSLHNYFMEHLYSNGSHIVRPRSTLKFLGTVVLSFAVSLLICLPSFATECYSDLDCTMGNRCQKKGGDDAKGVCLDGSQLPDTATRQSPVSDKPQRDTKGKMCWNSKDCEPGLECIMKSGQMYGICR